MSTQFSIQPVRPQDVPAVVSMVHELADYERAPRECHLTEALLHAALFGPRPALFGHVARDAGDQPVAMMLWYLNYSTWEGRHGIYLEDLYVRPAVRGNGLGKAMLATLAGVCRDRGYPRLEWWVLDWNPAREFYHSLGAVAMSEWEPYRLTGTPLDNLAREAVTQPLPGAYGTGASGMGAYGAGASGMGAYGAGAYGTVASGTARASVREATSKGPGLPHNTTTTA